MHVLLKDGAYAGQIRELRYSAAKELIDAGRAEEYRFDMPPAVSPAMIVGEKMAASPELPISRFHSSAKKRKS
jgi:hypothetical protein